MFHDTSSKVTCDIQDKLEVDVYDLRGSEDTQRKDNVLKSNRDNTLSDLSGIVCVSHTRTHTMLLSDFRLYAWNSITHYHHFTFRIIINLASF